MIRIFGKDNVLMTGEGKITKQGYAALLISTAFGVWLFLTGRNIYGKKRKEKK